MFFEYVNSGDHRPFRIYLFGVAVRISATFNLFSLICYDSVGHILKWPPCVLIFQLKVLIVRCITNVSALRGVAHRLEFF